jgi:hypothetical protein
MYAKLNPKALGWSLGFLWAVSTLLFHVLGFYYKDSSHMQNMLSLFSMSPEMSGMQLFMACLWALIYGFVVGSVLGCVYNAMIKCCGCNTSCDDNTCEDKGHKHVSLSGGLIQSVAAKSAAKKAAKKTPKKPAEKKLAVKKPAAKKAAAKK